ncbi:ABC transporter permease subunit [Lactobacillus sp. ESL0680]|uniref:ABC transporter permease n=1 Tax=Lactobacillus sp. ESL0680 TaxID=2983210 RepID=UPI0023FA0C40|nr:ABC transporter permease subunit [Lactobacillus sp. ESL0680]WEV38931.1 ABC transporter permease subunit [Lactobacillus sp. ESL0680]
MIHSIKQEFYKQEHKKITWFVPVILLVLMIMAAYTLGYGESKRLLMTCYDAPDWIMFILVISGATMFSMEFQNNAILTILYKASKKWDIYLAKYIVVIIDDCFLHVLAIIFTIFLKTVTFGATISWTAVYEYQQPIWLNMINTMLIDLLTTMLIISLVFLLSCLIANNAVVITVSFLVVFLGQVVSDNLLNLGKFVSVLKWNPLNMVSLTRQYYNFAMYYSTTHLANIQLMLGTLIYSLIFFILGYLIFRKRKF